MGRWIPALVLVALLTGCASAGPSPSGGPPVPDPSASHSPAIPAPKFIGAADARATFELTVGQTTTLRSTDPGAPEPELEGTSVLVIPVINVDASAGREWEVRAVEPGTSTLRGAEAGKEWEITLTVTD